MLSTRIRLSRPSIGPNNGTPPKLPEIASNGQTKNSLKPNERDERRFAGAGGGGFLPNKSPMTGGVLPLGNLRRE
jgi:hypothetical protein